MNKNNEIIRNQIINNGDIKSQNDAGKKSGVKPVRNAIDIIRMLSRNASGRKLTDISRELEINSSTCHSILKTLVSEGILHFDSGSKIYRTADGLLAMVGPVIASASIDQIFRESMSTLSNQYGITTSLWKTVNPERIELVACISSSQNMSIQMRLGQRMPRWVGAAGRVMAAFSKLSNEDLRKRFPDLKWQTSITFDQYIAQVQETRDKGFSIDRGDFASGVLTVGAPVWTPQGNLDWVLSGAFFLGQHNDATITKIAVELVNLGMRLAPNHNSLEGYCHPELSD